MDNVIELSKLWTVIKRSFWMMIVLAIIGGGAAFFGTKALIAPKYESSVAMLVNRKGENQQAGVQYADQQANVQIINTYKDIITQHVLLNKVAKNLTSPHKVMVKKETPATYVQKWDEVKQAYVSVQDQPKQPAQYKLAPAKYTDITADNLADQITIANATNSQVFTVTVKDTSAARARDIANEIAKVFRKEIFKMMSVKNVSIVSPALLKKEPVSPRTKIIALAGAVLGILIGFMWGLVRELTDRAVKSLDFLTDELGLTNLGVVQFIGKVDKSKTPQHNSPRSAGMRRSSTKRI